MNEMAIMLVFGFYAVLITFTAIVLVGLEEAADPHQCPPDEVAEWERTLIDMSHDA